MKNTTWNTYKTTLAYDDHQDHRSAGGVLHYQLRKTKDGWQTRICQINGHYEAISGYREMTEAEGVAAYATAKTRDPSAMNWTSCALQMPDDGEEVIVWSPVLGMTLARKEWEQGSTPNHWDVNHPDRRWELDDVTHWMPFPDPP